MKYTIDTDFTQKEIDKVYAILRELIMKRPDQYPILVSLCARAWSEYKEEYDASMSGMGALLWQVLTPKNAIEALNKKDSSGYFALDKFPWLKEQVEKIAEESAIRRKR